MMCMRVYWCSIFLNLIFLKTIYGPIITLPKPNYLKKEFTLHVLPRWMLIIKYKLVFFEFLSSKHSAKPKLYLDSKINFDNKYYINTIIYCQKINY